MKNEIIKVDSNVVKIFESLNKEIRSDYQRNDYIEEAQAVFNIGAMRSAITQFWNAVIHDMREKMIYRSLDLFKKEMSISKSISDYEGVQQHVTDYDLIEGSYKIGILDRESRMMLHQAREVRNLFGAHPYSNRPDPVKTVNMMMDCVRYVLAQPMPSKIINVDEYLKNMQDSSFDRNVTIIVNNFADLPTVYKHEFVHKIHKAYIHKDTPLTYIQNIEFVLPLISGLCDKEVKRSIASRTSVHALSGEMLVKERSIKFSEEFDSLKYLTHSVKLSVIEPLVDKLIDNLDNFSVENNVVNELEKFSDNIPLEIGKKYVEALTNTYVGRVGFSLQFSRTDFYANGASIIIPSMFEKLSSDFIDFFVSHISDSTILKDRIKANVKLKRLAKLCEVVISNASKDSSKILSRIIEKADSL